MGRMKSLHVQDAPARATRGTIGTRLSMRSTAPTSEDRHPPSHHPPPPPPPAMPLLTRANLQQYVGHPIGSSSGGEVPQSRIDAFAECTEDRQWIHVDVERAKSESPFGAPIAH